MTDHNISYLNARAKPRKLEVAVRITAAKRHVGALTPAERLVAAYALAEQGGVRLSEGLPASIGHRAAIRAHAVILLNLIGEDAFRGFLEGTAAMIGCSLVSTRAQ
jgi:hypothetical protein